MNENTERLLLQLRRGDEQAAQIVWREYFDRLVGVARRKLMNMPRRVVDEEDVALSALRTFYLRFQAGQFPDIDDRCGLWRLLVLITARKACKHRRRHYAQKAGGDRVVGEEVWLTEGDDQTLRVGIVAAPDNSPSPEMAAQLNESVERLLETLDAMDRSSSAPGERRVGLRVVAEMLLQGEPPAAIADALGCSRRTVERKASLIVEVARGIGGLDA